MLKADLRSHSVGLHERHRDSCADQFIFERFGDRLERMFARAVDAEEGKRDGARVLAGRRDSQGAGL